MELLIGETGEGVEQTSRELVGNKRRDHVRRAVPQRCGRQGRVYRVEVLTHASL